MYVCIPHIYSALGGQKRTRGPLELTTKQFSGESHASVYYHLYSVLLAGQERAPDLITDGCEPPCGCWELNSGPSEEQAMLLIAEPSLHPLDIFFLIIAEIFCPK